MVSFTRHAERRVRQRGCRDKFIEEVLTHADMQTEIGGGCCLYRVSRTRARHLNHDRMSRFGVIFNENKNHVVTVMPVSDGSRGRRYHIRNR